MKIRLSKQWGCSKVPVSQIKNLNVNFSQVTIKVEHKVILLQNIIFGELLYLFTFSFWNRNYCFNWCELSLLSKTKPLLISAFVDYWIVCVKYHQVVSFLHSQIHNSRITHKTHEIENHLFKRDAIIAIWYQPLRPRLLCFTHVFFFVMLQNEQNYCNCFYIFIKPDLSIIILFLSMTLMWIFIWRKFNLKLIDA